jgi:hypothetical protein
MKFSSQLKTDKKAQKLIQRWIKALRSGKYKQAHGVLRTGDNRYCCLGVLCDLVDHKGWSAKPKPFEDTTAFTHRRAATGGNLGKGTMPSGPLGDLVFFTGDMATDLADLNDDQGRSFTYIANVIEKAYRRATR